MHSKTKTHRHGAPTPARFPWRLLVYALVLVYLMVDLFWIGGPLRDWVDSRLPHSDASRTRAQEHGWVALVNGVPVLVEDVDRAVERRLALSGQDWDHLGTEARRLERIRALEQVVRERLLVTYSRLSPIREPDDEQAIAAELERWSELLAAAGAGPAEGMDAGELETLVRHEWRMARWVESRVAPTLEVTDDEVRAWLDQHRETMQVPQRFHVRHLYLIRPREPGDQRRQEIDRIDEALAGIDPASAHGLEVEPGPGWGGEAESEAQAAAVVDNGDADETAPGTTDWDRLVAEVSEDPATVDRGGALGWVSRERMPGDFMQAVEHAAADPGTISGPHATGLGWHWLVVDEMRPARPAEWHEVAHEIRALLETRRRHEAVERLIDSAKNRARIYYYMDVLLAGAEER